RGFHVVRVVVVVPIAVLVRHVVRAPPGQAGGGRDRGTVPQGIPVRPVPRRVASVPALVVRVVVVEPVLPVVARHVAVLLPVLAEVAAAVVPVLANLTPVPRGQLVRPAFPRQPFAEILSPLLDRAVRGAGADAGPPVAQARQHARAVAGA